MPAAKKTFEITPPKFETIIFKIIGITPYMQSKFSQKAIDKMITDQSGKGDKPNKSRKNREPKDFEQIAKDSIHFSKDGWAGIPATAFRAALVSACRVAGFTMTRAKISLFVEADGFDITEGTPLVKITKGEPHMNIMAGRNANGSTDLRSRAMWDEGWESVVRITYDSDQFTGTDVTNLLARAGFQVGIGEGRPDSRNSCGLSIGTFRIATEADDVATN